MNLQTPLSDIMTRNLFTVQEYDTLERVDYLFDKHNIHHIPVINEKGKLVGIVSKSDFLQISLGIPLKEEFETSVYNKAIYKTTLVRNLMSKNVVALQPEDTVETAANVFLENLFHAIPITSNGKLAGMITTYDLLKYSFKSEHKTIDKETNPFQPSFLT